MKYGEVTSVIKYITDNLSQTFEIPAPEEPAEGGETVAAEAPEAENNDR